MTIDEIKASTETYLWLHELVEVTGFKAQTMRNALRKDRFALGCDGVTRVGSKIKVPRKSYLKAIGEDDV